MRDKVLKDKKLEAYVLIKILKYCTGSSARSYQCKYAVNQVFMNMSVDSMDKVGAAIKEIIHHYNIRGKFSSVHPDLMKYGVTRVEVGEEGLQFIKNKESGEFLIYHQQGGQGGRLYRPLVKN